MILERVLDGGRNLRLLLLEQSNGLGLKAEAALAILLNTTAQADSPWAFHKAERPQKIGLRTPETIAPGMYEGLRPSRQLLGARVRRWERQRDALTYYCGIVCGSQPTTSTIMLCKQELTYSSGGWGGIRTLETLARLPVFKF